MKRLENICQAAQSAELPRRGPSRQQPRRALEQAVRRETVALRKWTESRGLTRIETASRLQLSPRTLRAWESEQAPKGWRISPRGRPVIRSPRGERNQVIALLNTLGPGVGLPTLQGHFPHLPRPELQDLLSRYRRLWSKKNSRLLHVLHWQRPGAVWAMDFAETEAPTPIEGHYPYLLAVRDLASGQQLAWLPTTDMTAQTTIDALVMLFTIHGAPLVLKSDNGSAFIAAETKRLLANWQVHALYSPPATPEYNGSCEAGIGSLKTRTHHQAARDGHAETWTGDNVEAARQSANTLARPRGPKGPTPAESWQSRSSITQAERAAFAQTVGLLEAEVRQREGLPPEPLLGHYEQAAIDREVLRRALVAHGFLLFTRRRIHPPIRSGKVSGIT